MMTDSDVRRPSSRATTCNPSDSTSYSDDKPPMNQWLGAETNGKGSPCVESTPIDSKPSARPFMRNWRRVIVAIASYIVLLVVPWSLTCIMIFRPLTVSAYVRYRNFFRASDFDFNERAQVFVSVLNTIRAIATLPAIGVVLSQAAVIHVQRRSPAQSLSILSTFAFADHGWSDSRHLWRMVRAFWRQHRPDHFLVLASVVTLLFAIVQPLEQLLVTTSSVRVATCQNNLACTNITESGLISTVGYDPWPEGFNQIALYTVARDVAASLAAQLAWDKNPYLWPQHGQGVQINGYPAELQTPQFVFDKRLLRPQPFFASSLPAGVSTGAIRQHAMRLNSSVGCEKIEFPSTCTGHRPLSASHTVHTGARHLDIQVCAPGDYGNPVFTNSRNRQDILEEIYLKIDIGSDYNVYRMPGLPHISNSIEMRCSVVTTRGYFEVNNDFIGEQQQGYLLSEWPSMDEIDKKFADLRDPRYWDYRALLDHDNFTAGTKEDGQVMKWGQRYAHRGFWHMEDGKPARPFGTPGPLLTSAVALFGPDSFFDIITTHEPSQAFRLLCITDRLPFYNFGIAGRKKLVGYHIPSCQYLERQDVDTDSILASFFNNFLDPGIAEHLLSFSVFQANRATLAEAALMVQDRKLDRHDHHGRFSAELNFFDDWETRLPRDIFAASSHLTHKPSAALASVVLLSILYTMQLTVLLVAARYFSTHPTWSSGLDAMTLARLVASMAPEDLQCLATLEDREGSIETLREMDGLVGLKKGVHGTGDEAEEISEGVTKASGRELSGKDLALGGPGVIGK